MFTKRQREIQSFHPERTVGLNLSMDMTEVPPGIQVPRVEICIQGGTLTPEQARKILDVLGEDSVERSPLLDSSLDSSQG